MISFKYFPKFTYSTMNHFGDITTFMHLQQLEVA